MSVLHAILLFVAAQRGLELMLAARNTRRLREMGAVEIDARAYPLFVVLHGGWLAAMAVMIPAETAPSWPLVGLFALLQLARVWVIATLGRRWTTRIIVLPNAAPVTSGPYRWCRHPNYLIVAGEIAVLPLAFGAVAIAAIFSLLNAALLARRVRIETAALRAACSAAHPLRRRAGSAPRSTLDGYTNSNPVKRYDWHVVARTLLPLRGHRRASGCAGRLRD